MKISHKYTFYQIRTLALILIFIGGINYGFELFNINLIQIISNLLNIGYNLKNIIHLLITISVIYLLLIDKNIFTPFLGESVIPTILLNKKIPKNADKSIIIQTDPGRKIVYWASKGKDNNIVWKAYGNYSNSGVVIADKNGKATLKFKTPSAYILPNKNKLSPHIHYRECALINEKESMLGPLKTIKIK